MNCVKELPITFIDEYLKVDTSIPVLSLRWKKSPARCIKQESPAGYITDDWNGNPIGRVRIKGKAYLNHRVVYYLMYKKDPGKDVTIDHKYFDYINNTELRCATRIQQAQNRRKRRGEYTSQFKGVRWRKDCKKWAAQISVNKKRISLGVYDLSLIHI
jgi:hypothetical protein